MGSAMAAERDAPLVAAKPGRFVRRLADLDTPCGRSETADPKLDAMGVGYSMLMRSVDTHALRGTCYRRPAGGTQ